MLLLFMMMIITRMTFLVVVSENHYDGSVVADIGDYLVSLLINLFTIISFVIMHFWLK